MTLLEGWTRFRNAAIFLYSMLIMATTLPGFDRIPHTIILPYFIILPGYALSMVLRQAEGIVQTFFYSLVWSVVILGSVYSLTTLSSSLSAIPLSALIPVLTVILTAYSYYHGRQ